MSRRTDNERLLADVIAGESDAAFHEALLGETLRLACSRRRFRQARQAAAVVAVLVGLATLVWQGLLPRLATPAQCGELRDHSHRAAARNSDCDNATSAG